MPWSNAPKAMPWAKVYHRPVNAQHIAGAPFADLEGGLQVGHRLPLGSRSHHLFCSDLLEHGVIKHRIGQKPLQPRVLILKLAQLAHL
jgi:hypothetical protein